MYKYKKMTIKLIALLYIVITIIETVKYLFSDSNIFGLIYLLISSFIIFLLVPTSHNYNRYYSSARISKLIIIFILGIFSSYFLNKIVLNMSYVDSSNVYIDSVFVYKNILKGIIYFFIFVFTLFEFKLDKLLLNNSKKKKSWFLGHFVV